MKIDITEKAVEELKKIVDKKDTGDKCIRVYVAGFG